MTLPKKKLSALSATAGADHTKDDEQKKTSVIPRVSPHKTSNADGAKDVPEKRISPAYHGHHPTVHKRQSSNQEEDKKRSLSSSKGAERAIGSFLIRPNLNEPNLVGDDGHRTSKSSSLASRRSSGGQSSTGRKKRRRSPTNPVLIFHPNIIGNCPICRIGNVHKSLNFFALFGLIFFLPVGGVGLVFLLCLYQHQCDYCGELV